MDAEWFPGRRRTTPAVAWHEAIKIEFDGHKTTGAYETVTPPQWRNSVGAKWVFTYGTGKDGQRVKTKAG